MKRLLVLLLGLLFLASAVTAEESSSVAVNTKEHVFLGSYEQDNNPDNGAEPIEWIPIDYSEGKTLLISKYALDCQAFNTVKEDTDWKSSSIRTWLNDAFFNAAFTGEEQTAVLPTTVSNGANEQNPAWTGRITEDTIDRVFLLSYREVNSYFPGTNDRKTSGTEYARSKGAKFLGFTTIGYGETDWWLRSPGASANEAAYVGVVRDINTKGVSDKVGIRPAIWLDASVDRSFFQYEQYVKASQFEAEGKYEDAANIFEALGTYNGSVECTRRVRYLHAQKATAENDYNTALRLYELIGDYEDSFIQARACRYALAVEKQDAGEYETAAKMFEKAGQYKDSMSRLKQCYEKLGISIYYFGTEAVSTGVDTGYSKSEVINGNDRHFGWRLGQFFTSGFTRVTTNDAGQPVFIKTLGDSVTLWFDIEQNIDALNNNTNLVINGDANGYNQYFGVKKTNFGRGTLIVRHTNYQNNKGAPQIYTDYLLAKGTSGADTKVVLHEEGDYEVVLDYEIADNDITHFTNKYGNYQISVAFSVRNGNCMVYPFDVLTGAELQNTSITENGFSLDLARSRYLDINVKRSVIVEGPAGMIEDERFNRPAKDGDQYTAEGIYTISVSNRYTGESTTKTIFVGSDALLQEYIANGFSPDRLK